MSSYDDTNSDFGSTVKSSASIPAPKPKAKPKPAPMDPYDCHKKANKDNQDRVIQLDLEYPESNDITSHGEEELEDDDDSLEEPYTQDLGIEINSEDELDMYKEQTKSGEPIRPGDVIEYFNPIFVKGRYVCVWITLH